MFKHTVTQQDLRVAKITESQLYDHFCNSSPTKVTQNKSQSAHNDPIS